MEPTRELGKFLLIAGVLVAAAGAFLLLGWRLPFRLGHLPGDISLEGRGGGFYFPIVTCIVLSIVLTILFRLAGWLFK